MKYLTEEQVIAIIRENVEKQFPKNCRACGLLFRSLKEYLENVEHLGKPRSYDAENKSWKPRMPLGTFSFSKCKNCGNTMAIGSSKMNILTMWELLRWAKMETKKKGISVSHLLNELRQKIDNQVLNERGLTHGKYFDK